MFEGTESFGTAYKYHNLCFEQKFDNYWNFSSESFNFYGAKISVYLNRNVFVMARLVHLPA